MGILEVSMAAVSVAALPNTTSIIPKPPTKLEMRQPTKRPGIASAHPWEERQGFGDPYLHRTEGQRGEDQGQGRISTAYQGSPDKAYRWGVRPLLEAFVAVHERTQLPFKVSRSGCDRPRDTTASRSRTGKTSRE